MPASKKPRKRYQPKDWGAEAAHQRALAEGETTGAPKEVPIDKEPPAPAHPHVIHPSSPRAPRGRGRYLVPVTAGAGVIGGGAFLAHRARRKKAEMAKGLIDPTTGESVSYERSYLDAEVDKAHEGKLRGALVAKGLRSSAGKLGRGIKDFGSEVFETSSAGAQARGARAAESGKIGGARRAGRIVGVATPYAATAGTYYGIGRLDRDGNKRMGPADHRRARMKAAAKKEKTAKRYDETAVEHHGSRRGGRTPVSSVRRVPGLPVQSATFGHGNAEARPGTRSHANKLTHVRNGSAKGRTGRLVVVRRSGRSASGSKVGKSVGFAQSAGNGRRLVEA